MQRGYVADNFLVVSAERGDRKRVQCSRSLAYIAWMTAVEMVPTPRKPMRISYVLMLQPHRHPAP
jgi:hypothetical protein